MKKNKKLLLAAVAIILAAVALIGIYLSARPSPTVGDKTITVSVVHGNASSKSFTYYTDEAYLGDVLLKEGLIAGGEGEFGLYILTVDGETADYDTDNAYWALYQGENYASVGISQLPIADGDSFSLVYTIA